MVMPLKFAERHSMDPGRVGRQQRFFEKIYQRLVQSVTGGLSWRRWCYCLLERISFNLYGLKVSLILKRGEHEVLGRLVSPRLYLAVDFFSQLGRYIDHV